MRRLFRSIGSETTMRILFKLICIAGVIYSYLHISFGKVYEICFVLSVLLLYETESNNEFIKDFRYRHRNYYGMFIILPFVIVTGYVYGILDLNFFTVDIFQIDSIANCVIDKGIYIGGCVVLMIVVFCRLRAIPYFGGFEIPVFVCIIFAGSLLGMLIGKWEYIPLGIIITYLYEKFNFPSLIAIVTLLCLIEPFGEYASVIAFVNVIFILALSKRLQRYGNPVFLLTGCKKDLIL